ncbi:hypothetical protein C1H57_25480, partial [Clostridium sp. 2-1]|uniref:hypothetical protein n=1 Tax=Clostridium sp. 2-1 TaxID=2070758 RepID=UPI000D4799C4
NREYVVNWQDDGLELQTKRSPDGKRIWAHNFNLDYVLKKHIGWSDVTSGNISFRAYEDGVIFDSASNAAFTSEKNYYPLLGYLNSIIVKELSVAINPTIHFKPGDFYCLPYIKINS